MTTLMPSTTTGGGRASSLRFYKVPDTLCSSGSPATGSSLMRASLGFIGSGSTEIESRLLSLNLLFYLNQLGDKAFSPWKGSVDDSVIGVILTQNVRQFLKYHDDKSRVKDSTKSCKIFVVYTTTFEDFKASIS